MRAKHIHDAFGAFLSKFYLNEVDIVVPRLPGVKFTAIGIDLASGKPVLTESENLETPYEFVFKAASNQCVRIEFQFIFGINRNFYVLFVTKREPLALAFERIAHAMGRYRGLHYTNSFPAFLGSYARGFRVFEVDLQLTSDRRCILFHDEKNYDGDRWLSRSTKKISSRFFKAFSYADGVPLMFLEDLAELIIKHPDVYVVLDIKSGYPRYSRPKNLAARLYRSYKKRIKWDGDIVTEFAKRVLGEALRASDYHCLKRLKSLIGHDEGALSRVIPQVHEGNIHDVLDVYDFPLKIWRDNRGGFESDMQLAKRACIGNYSANARKMTSAKLAQIKEQGLKLFLYNTTETDLELADGYYED